MAHVRSKTPRETGLTVTCTLNWEAVLLFPIDLVMSFGILHFRKLHQQTIQPRSYLSTYFDSPISDFTHFSNPPLAIIS